MPEPTPDPSGDAVDVNVLVDVLGRRIGQLEVDLTVLRLRLDASLAEVTRLRGESVGTSAGGPT